MSFVNWIEVCVFFLRMSFVNWTEVCVSFLKFKLWKWGVTSLEKNIYI